MADCVAEQHWPSHWQTNTAEADDDDDAAANDDADRLAGCDTVPGDDYLLNRVSGKRTSHKRRSHAHNGPSIGTYEIELDVSDSPKLGIVTSPAKPSGRRVDVINAGRIKQWNKVAGTKIEIGDVIETANGIAIDGGTSKPLVGHAVDKRLCLRLHKGEQRGATGRPTVADQDLATAVADIAARAAENDAGTITNGARLELAY